jgi:hypothetical protein
VSTRAGRPARALGAAARAPHSPGPGTGGAGSRTIYSASVTRGITIRHGPPHVCASDAFV